MKIKQKVLMVSLVVLSTLCSAAEPEEQEKWSSGELVAVAVTAEALAIWGAHELGDNREESHHNVKILLGIQLGWFLGLLYEDYKGKDSENASIMLNGDSLAFRYAF